ncbi:hypothetical protein L198_06602 [Cryptococcus wingfieldii CBS 7118]|uniref:Uncharacterized protein n=1 Tax=Cryptococcus wingfieldii CBS 7118 TaxID=1295528 RepID=A0A1E3IJN3_9TREE|nr:hypothetical protein L198_06602 [Cryptococcus wingfieldii CBS 7118]ODN88800.1 hypothetical protein L198_06602 [Cryptococcus wingfieldii CBS 7118]
MPSAAWKSSFRSPSPDTDSEDCLPSQFAASTHADLAYDLDLSLRQDHAELKSTPFTIAKQKSARKGGRKISNLVTAEDRRNGVTSSPSKSSTTKSSNSRPVLNNQTLPFQPQPRKPGPKPAKKDFVQQPLHDTPPKPKNRKKPGPSAAWVDKDGNALPEDPPARLSILEVLEEKEKEEEKKVKKREAAREKRKRTVEAKKREKEGNDKIQFHMLPKGAATNESFPIVRALQKQQSLPSRTRPLAATSIRLNEGEVTRSPEPENLVDATEIDDLVYGPKGARGGTTVEDAIEIASTPTLNRKAEWSESIRTTPTLVGSDSRSAQRHHDLPFAKTTHRVTPSSRSTFKPPFKKPFVDHVSPQNGHIDPHSSSEPHLSTINQVPSSLSRGGETMTSGVSKLAYSSPLTGRGRAGDSVAHVRAMARASDTKGRKVFEEDDVYVKEEEDEYRSADVLRLERAAEDFHIPPAYQSALPPNIARPVARRFQPPIPVVSKSTLNQDRNSPPPIRSSTPEWSTLPAKRRRDSSFNSPNKNARQPVVAGRFRMPASLFPTPKRTAPSSPSPEPAINSPPRKYSKLTLFTPSSKEDDALRPERPAYTVRTIRGSKFASSAERNDSYPGAGVKGRLTLPPRKTGSSTTLGRREPERDYSPADQRAGQSRYDPFQSQYRRYDTTGEEEGDEDDWTSAWRGKESANVGAMGGRDWVDEDELEAAEKYVFQRRNGYDY